MDVDLGYPERPPEIAGWTAQEVADLESDVRDALCALFDPTSVRFENFGFAACLPRPGPVQDPPLSARVFFWAFDDDDPESGEILFECNGAACTAPLDDALYVGAGNVFAHYQSAGLGYDDLVRSLALAFARGICMAYGLPDLVPDPTTVPPDALLPFTTEQVAAIDAAITY